MCDEKLVSSQDLGLINEQNNSINLRHVRQVAEKNAILRALAVTDGNISAAAKQLGVTRPTLYDLFKKYNVKIASE